MILPGLPTLAHSSRIPHENPANAEELMDEVTLLLSYSSIINTATNRQYEAAQNVLEELRNVRIPDEIRYIAGQYRQLCQQIFTTLDGIEAILDEASYLLSVSHLYDAKQKIDTAGENLQKARVQMEEIEVTTTILSNRLGVFSSSAGTRLTQAGTQLEESVERLGEMILLENVARLKELVEDYNKQWRALSEKYTEMKLSATTELTLSASPPFTYVGDSINASGTLINNGKPLAYRELALILKSSPATDSYNETVFATLNTTTGFDGSYFTSMRIPYEYVDRMTLTALYEPAGGDLNIYQPGQSAVAVIKTMFHDTTLEASLPGSAHPGLPLTIKGWTSSAGGNIDRTVQVLMDDMIIKESEVSGPFSFEATTPERAAIAQHNLKVVVVPQGRYAGAYEEQAINITRIPVYLDFKTPLLAILPHKINISGRIFNDKGTAIPGAGINLTFRNLKNTLLTSADGSFSSTIGLPALPESTSLSANPLYVSAPASGSSFDLSPIRRQEITLAVEPAEPWYTPLTIKKKLFIVNPISMIPTLLFLVASGLILYRKRQTPVFKGEWLTVPAEVPSIPVFTRVPKTRRGLSVIRRRVISAYNNALVSVEKYSRVGMRPNSTLREFLALANLPSQIAKARFIELTNIAENALYAGHEPGEKGIARAEQLAADIGEELHRDAS